MTKSKEPRGGMTAVFRKTCPWSELPAKTELSEEIFQDLKKSGLGFVGPTIICAFLQAVGIINDHTVDCFRYCEIEEAE